MPTLRAHGVWSESGPSDKVVKQSRPTVAEKEPLMGYADSSACGSYGSDQNDAGEPRNLGGSSKRYQGKEHRGKSKLRP